MRIPSARLAVVLVAALLLTTACGGSGSGSDVEIAADGTFTATALDGSAVDQADYAGQDVMLWFWAPW